MRKTIDEMFEKTANRNPEIKQQLEARLAQVKEQSKNLSPSEQRAALEEAAAVFKREAVEKNVSQEAFLEQVTKNAARTLFTTPEKYEKYHRGVEKRIKQAIDSVPAELKTDPRNF